MPSANQMTYCCSAIITVERQAGGPGSLFDMNLEANAEGRNEERREH